MKKFVFKANSKAVFTGKMSLTSILAASVDVHHRAWSSESSGTTSTNYQKNTSTASSSFYSREIRANYFNLLTNPEKMAEASSEAAPQVAETEPTPITNGTAAMEPADVTMADSTDIPVSTEQTSQTTILPETLPEALPEAQSEALQESQPETQTASTPAPVLAPTPTPAPAAPASSRNSPHPSGPQQAPTHPIPHGSPTRVYLNQHVTPHLLEAMKHLATNEPEKPLKFLSEFLAMKSAEIEG